MTIGAWQPAAEPSCSGFIIHAGRVQNLTIDYRVYHDCDTLQSFAIRMRVEF